MAMEFAGYPGYGITITIDGVPIWGVQDVSGPALSTDTADTSNHSSPGGTEQRVATLKRTGEITFPMIVRPDDAGQQALYAAWQDTEAHAIVMTKRSGIVHSFDGLVTSLGDSAAVTDAEKWDVTIVPIAWPEDATTFPS